MNRTSLVACLIFVSVGRVRAADTFETTIRPVLREHCIVCHGQGDDVEGEVNLAEIQRTSELTKNPDLLRKLVQVMKRAEMPPEDEPPLDDAVRAKLAATFQRLLTESVAAQHHGGHTPVRRMNRFQYNNAVTDLFQLDCIVFTLPERMMREHKNYFRPETGRMAETVTVGSRPLGKSQLIEPRLAGVAPFPQDLRAEHGYDNRGDHLSLSPLLMESFLRLGRSITESPDFNSQRVGIWNDFFAPPDTEQDLPKIIRERLRPFLTLAFRRPVEPRVLDRYATFVRRQVEQGEDFTTAMKAVAAATIASPKFLYLYERAGDGGGPQRLDDLELASRLSFFLWGSIPDEELLQVAAAGKLREHAILIEQVDRMLRDQKLKRFCDSFPSQWLQLERIISSVPNPDRFPEFYFSKYRDSMHMMLEPLLLFETVLIENHSITQFIDSDFTYRSKLLRDAYRTDLTPAEKQRGGAVGILTFQREPITDRRYGGVITTAATLTMTSGQNETKPITRGAWLATVIFNDPPDPPPADVPPLPEKPAEGQEQLTLRERLSAHRERADCRGCHEKIDPLGFALENYNAIGVWRDRYENGREVDMAGALFRKRRFKNVTEFKDAILAEKDQFTEGFASHLLSFAVARELTAADTVAVRKIAEAAAADDYRIQSVIKQVVLSEPFHLKTSGPRENRLDDAHGADSERTENDQE